MGKYVKGYQPIGVEGFAKACPTCFNQGTDLCFKCKMEVESGYDPMAVSAIKENEKHTMYGGQRGGGKIFALEQKIARLQDELKAVRAERDMYAGEIAKVCVTDDILRDQMVIRINYSVLVDPCVAMDAIIRELQNMMKP